MLVVLGIFGTMLVLSILGYTFDVRERVMILRERRRALLGQMEKVQPGTELYIELANRAVEADKESRNVVAKDVVVVAKAVGANNVARREQKAIEQRQDNLLDTARIAVMENQAKQLTSRLVNRMNELEAAGEVVDPVVRKALEGKVL